MEGAVDSRCALGGGGAVVRRIFGMGAAVEKARLAQQLVAAQLKAAFAGKLEAGAGNLDSGG